MVLEPEFLEGLLLDLLTPLLALEKAASSMLLLFLEGLVDPEEGLDKLSVFNLEDDS